MYIAVVQTEYTHRREIGAHRLLRKWSIPNNITLYIIITVADCRLYTTQFYYNGNNKI